MEAPGNSVAQSADKSIVDNQNAATRPCACGAICWQCCGQVPGLAEVGGLSDHSGIQLSDSTLQLRLTEYASMQSNHSGSNIRTLRSWSSSDKHGPRLEDQGKGGRGPRRFSVAGPAGSGGSTGSRQSQKHLSLHTWAEEDELPDTSGSFNNPAMAASASALASRNGVAGHAGKHSQAANHYHSLSHGNHQAATRHFAHNNSSNSSVSSTGVFGKRAVPDATFGFLDVSSTGSSSGPPSTQHTASLGGHRRLRTPCSISIPSMIGSPLSFTQSFLASRSSMYGRQPPSSQIRAAHIDWDSLSMMEEAWGGVNRGDLPVWHGMGLPIDVACGGGIAAKPNLLQLNFQRAHLPAGEAIPQHLQHIYQQQYPNHQLLYHLQQQQQQLQQAQRQQATRHSGPMHAAITSGGGLPGTLGDVCASMAQVAVTSEWERQMSWDYACHHHPLLASFSVASPLKLSAVWRWALLV
ncbi:hypothetical protein GGI18_003528, partial [Coemansia linderi]